MSARPDHLVVAASSLQAGVQWCETHLGITPGPGGEHPLMGTHNRLVNIASAAYPQAYLEIIAIDGGAPCARSGGQKRWFDLDCPALQTQLQAQGPQLVHFVAQTKNAALAVQALSALGHDRGALLAASRMTPHGPLNWRISVRDDGQRLWGGVLPTLIQWGDMHPTQGMAPSGVSLTALHVSSPHSETLQAAYAAIGLVGVTVQQGLPCWHARLQTPRGDLMLPGYDA